MRPTVGKASLQVVASARQSSFSGYGAFTAAAKQQSSRGMRSGMRRSAVLTKAKVTIAAAVLKDRACTQHLSRVHS